MGKASLLAGGAFTKCEPGAAGRIWKRGAAEWVSDEFFNKKSSSQAICRLRRVGAADGTRTRTPRGHKHLKLASLPIPAQPHPDGPRKNRLIIILSRRGFVNYYLDRPRRKIGSFLRCPGFFCFGLLGDGLFLLQQLLVQLDGVPLTVAVGQHRLQGDGGQLG